MTLSLLFRIVTVSSLLCIVGCTTCDKSEPCERADYALEPRGLLQGIAGVAYEESDVVSNGCRDCQYQSYLFHLWRFDSEPSMAVVTATLADETPPDQSLRVDEQYAHPLESAHYLYCTETMPRSCAVLDLSEEVVWTVHLRGGFSVPSPNLKIFRPDGSLDENLPFLYPES